MKSLIIVFLSILTLTVQSQTRRSSTKTKIDSKSSVLSPKESKASITQKDVSDKKEDIKKEKNKQENSFLSETISKDNKVDKKESSTSPIIPTNTSAIANGEANVKTEAPFRIYEYKADEKSVDYYRDLRKKFDLEERIKKEKDAKLATEKAKQEDELKKSRHLSQDQAPQFDKYREGAKNSEVKKTSAEDDYKSIFQ